MPKISDLPAATTVNSNDLFVVVASTGTAATKKATATATAGSLLALANGVKSDTTVVSGSTQIVNVISLTQAQYDNLQTKSADTLYLIKD